MFNTNISKHTHSQRQWAPMTNAIRPRLGIIHSCWHDIGNFGQDDSCNSPGAFWDTRGPHVSCHILDLRGNVYSQNKRKDCGWRMDSRAGKPTLGVIFLFRRIWLSGGTYSNPSSRPKSIGKSIAYMYISYAVLLHFKRSTHSRR